MQIGTVDYYHCICTCGASGPLTETRDGASAAWNRAHPDISTLAAANKAQAERISELERDARKGEEMSDNFDKMKAKFDQMKQREVAKIEATLRDELAFMDAKLAEMRAELAEAVDTLRQIARQKLAPEYEDGNEETEGGDFEYGYEAIVKLARAYFAAHPAPKAPDGPSYRSGA
ncbi:hypothetical protein M0R72_13610 [Candidatus Pacearchaeota archaeon]|jgi:hypothetical protein|nr:hypothetical protein [Candidatus Pacearchaeota archaeon]